MRRKKRRLLPYFQVGHKVELKLPATPIGRDYLDGRCGTIIQIRKPSLFEFDTLEEALEHWRFWVKLDDFPELDNYCKNHETPVRYSQLRPLSPSISKQKLLQYCWECSLKAMKEQRRFQYDAYLKMTRYLSGQSGFPCLDLLDCLLPKGYYVDLVNRFISGATEIRKLAQQAREAHPASEVAERYEAQAQVCDEMLLLLIPR